MCTALVKIADEGRLCFSTKNYENAYLLLGRYMNILTRLQKRPDYEKYKDLIREKVGGNEKQLLLMEQLEKSKNKLIEKEKEYSVTMLKENSVLAILPVEIAKSTNGKVANESQEIREIIDCKTLYEMMERDSKKFLIVDCRPNEDFERSKILFQFVCNVPEEFCFLGMTSSKIEQSLPNESKVCWNMRGERPIIVFIDWFSTTFVRNSTVWNLRNILIEWDPDVDKKPEMILLEGGYESWLITYPMKCSDPHVKPPRDNNTSTPTVDGIEYPNWEDIVMKDQSINNISTSQSIPAVDRTTKNNAIKSYEKNLSQSELLEKKEKLLNKSLQNNIEIVKLERDLNAVVTNEENAEDKAKMNQEIMYAMMELDTKEKDITLESEQIEQELKYAPKTIISRVEDIEMRLKLQLAELERKKKEAEALRIAREKKKPFDDYNNGPVKAPRKSELILSPKTLNQNIVPQFDRSSKPTNQIIPQSFYNKQDFSPVYQKVVSSFINILISVTGVNFDHF